METGQKFDAGKPPLGLLSRHALVETAKVLDFGQRKYARHNWRQGIEWQRCVDALLRHALAYNEGEDVDAETGLSHMAHAMAEAMFLLEFEVSHRELDDRWKEAR